MNIVSKDWAGVERTLVHIATGFPVQMNERVVEDDRKLMITGGRAPHKSGSSGRVWVKEGKALYEWFPHVCDMKWE